MADTATETRTRLQRYKASSTARNTARHGTAQTIVTDMARSTTDPHMQMDYTGNTDYTDRHGQHGLPLPPRTDTGNTDWHGPTRATRTGTDRHGQHGLADVCVCAYVFVQMSADIGRFIVVTL